MIGIVLVASLMQSSCSPEATALITSAAEHAAAFDVAGAAQRLQAAVKSGCADAVLPSAYLRGWIAARDAYRLGGSPQSLRPLMQSIAILEQRGGTTGPAQIATLVLRAAAAAAQSERDELALMIDYAAQLEDRNLAAGLPGLPMITAHEVAGDLWLQVHRYDDARRAYERAATRIGPTPRVTLGLARVAARLDATSTACAQYQRLVTSWKSQNADPPELSEARAFLSGAACGAASNAR
jgi:hypothetical protein